MFNTKNKFYVDKIHFFFLFILSLNYLIPLIIFGDITLFYLDALDGEIPYNLVIGKFLRGDFDAIKVFLNGELDILFLRRIFQLYSLIYSIFNLELAYWIIDILVKTTSYISFFILAKKINKNLFLCGLISCLYASSNLPTHEGFGLAIFPYLIYLIIYKDNLRLKHFLLIIFFGLNSDFIFTAFAMISFGLLILVINKKKNITNFFIVLALFSFSLIISNINLLIITIQNIPVHREEFVKPVLSIKESFIFFFQNLLSIPYSWNMSFFLNFPHFLYKLPILFFALFPKDRCIKKILLTLFLTGFFVALIQIEFVQSFVNSKSNLIKTLSWTYILKSYTLIFCLIGIFLLKKENLPNKIIIFFIFFSVFIFQINSSIIPFGKKIVFKEKNYQNLYTFKGYYHFHNYKNIKDIVQNNRVMSVGLDPMVATIHSIKVIDGYHSLYPLSYKKKFREIIQDELDSNLKFKRYFNQWGSRLYTSLYKPRNPEAFKLNYQKAKNLGAEFIISSLSLESPQLNLIYGNCEVNNFCLYKIN